MSGYNGYSMSNNAVAAYQDDRKPLSKWRKSEIIDMIIESCEDEKIEYDIKKINKINLKFLKVNFLERTEWHHTGKFYNETNFYAFDDRHIQNENFGKEIDLILARQDQVKQEEKEKEVAAAPEIRKAEFLEWAGTRKHPKATTVTASGEVKGNWFYLEDGSKKSINANGFRFLN